MPEQPPVAVMGASSPCKAPSRPMAHLVCVLPYRWSTYRNREPLITVDMNSAPLIWKFGYVLQLRYDAMKLCL